MPGLTGHLGINHQFLIHRPEHQVGEIHQLVVVHIPGIDDLVLPVGEVGFGLDHVGVAFLADLFLLPEPGERRLGRNGLGFVDVDEPFVIDHVVVGFHHREADVGFHLFLLRLPDGQRRLRDLQVVDRTEAVEQVDARPHGIAVVERGLRDIGIRFRVDAAAEIVISIGASAHRRGEGTEQRIAPCDLRVAGFSLLDPHFRGIGDGVLHTVVERHLAGHLGLRRPNRRKPEPNNHNY